MKNIFLIFCFIMLFLTSSVQAKSIKVISLDDFSTANPPTVFKVKTVESKDISNDIFLPENTVISGIVLRVEGPKVGKRDAYFEFLPTSLTYQGKSLEINNSKIYAKIIRYKPTKPEKLAFDVTKKAANIFLKGLINGIEFAQGAIQAENGQRIKSGAMKVYNNSFLSYISVGSELNIKATDILILKIKKIH